MAGVQDGRMEADAAQAEGGGSSHPVDHAAARGLWQRAGLGVRLLRSLKSTSVVGVRKSEKHLKKISLVAEPSSEQGAAVRVMARLGVHGDSVGREYEAPNVNLGAALHKACRGRMTAEQLGRACAEVDATARRVIKAPWEDPALSAGGSSLFDPTLGGGGIFLKRGETRSFRPGDTVMCQHRGASANTHWYGRLGYRGLGALETYRSDIPANRLTGAYGPWILLPSTPSSLRRRDQLSRSVPELARSIPRQQSRETWEKLNPDHIFGNYRRFQSYSLSHDHHIGGHITDIVGNMSFAMKQTAHYNKRLKHLTIVQLSRMWDRIEKDAVGKKWYEMSLEVASWSQRRIEEDERRALAVEMHKEESNRRIEGLLRRAELEKEEAEAAVERVNKERAEYLKALEKLEEGKNKFMEMTAEAEADGAVDDEEAKMLQKELLDVQIAEARLKKEQDEFEEWEARALKEIQEYEDMKHRCDLEIQRQTQWLHEAHAVAHEASLIKYNADYLQYSVLARLHTYRPRHGTPEFEAEHMFDNLDIIESQNAADDTLVEVETVHHFHVTTKLQHACVYREDFVGYSGQWCNGRPAGHGSERHDSMELEYAGQFSDDLWDGWGMLATFAFQSVYVGGYRGVCGAVFHLCLLACFFCCLTPCNCDTMSKATWNGLTGKWEKGRREGPGILCGLTSEGAMVPLIFCECKEGLIHQHWRFEANSKMHNKVFSTAAAEINKGLVEATVARRLLGNDTHTNSMTTTPPLSRQNFTNSMGIK